MRRGCWDIHERVKDMSAGGVLACMCFPSFPSFSGRLFLGVDDKELAAALVRGVQRLAHRRLVRLVSRSPHPDGAADVVGSEATAAEIRRTAAKGCHSLTFTENPATLGLPSFHSDHWDPMWEALVETSTILNVHLGSSGQLAVTAPDAPMDVMITLQPMNICMAAADLVWSRVFKQYRDLRVALSEGGTGWIPYFLDRLDRTYDMHHLWTRQDLGSRAAERRLPPPHPHLLHRRPRRHPAARRHRAGQHLLGAGLPALRLVMAARAGGVAPGGRAIRRARRGPAQDHARERDALVRVRSVRAPRQGVVHGRRATSRGQRVTTWPFGRWTPDVATKRRSVSATSRDAPRHEQAGSPSRPSPRDQPHTDPRRGRGGLRARRAITRRRSKRSRTVAEFSVGAVYGFFEHKDDLFVQIYRRRGAEFMDGMRSLMTSKRPPVEQLHALADYQIDFFRTHPNFGRLYLHTSAVVLGDLETKIDDLVADRYAEAMSLQSAMFRAGQRGGSLRSGDPDVVARLFSAMVAAYQSADLAGTGTMTVTQFHAFLDGAFRA